MKQHLELRRSRGFTLIEIIVVMGVFAVLMATLVAVINPGEQLKKGADGRRKTDLSQLQKALELYYQDYGQYPLSEPDNNTIVTSEGVEKNWGDDFRPYMEVLPEDESSDRSYAYWSADGRSYALYASLERGDSDPQACDGVGDNACPGAANLAGGKDACGDVCNYGVTSSNISP